MIEKAAAVNTAVERPARAVLNEPGLHSSWRQLPQLLESQSVGLRRFTGIELVAGNQLLGRAAAAALAEHRDLRVNFRTQSKIRSRLAALLDAHVADANALDGAAQVEQRFRRRETGKYVHTQFFGFRAQNRHQLAKRDDQIAVIVHLRRRYG